MTLADLRTLYQYNRWANRRLLGTASRLAADDFAREAGPSGRSVREILVHILWGEWLWLQRWRGESPRRVFDPADFTIQALQSAWAEVEKDQEAVLSTLTDDRLADRVAYVNMHGQRWEYPLVHMMQHTANHSSYHRGQVSMLLRALGEEPPATDFLVYFDELPAEASSLAAAPARG
jgi:uncharacterized damage-inducible protein DinB